MRFFRSISSPVGDLLALACDDHLTHLLFADGLTASDRTSLLGGAREEPCEVLSATTEQLEDYFGRRREVFDLPLRPAGTPFQERVWEGLAAIPFAQTISYGELARRIGKPTAVRAVGGANNKNPISIVIPCHRVIGHANALVGYGGGLERKQALLVHEGAEVTNPRQLQLLC